MRPAVLFLLLPLAAAPALAGDEPTAAPAGRYQIAPSRDGFVRLDTRTGAASHCGYDGNAWVCEPLDQPDSALAARVDALARQVATLTAAVRLLAAAGTRPVAADQVAAPPSPRPGLAERVVAPLFDFVRRLKERRAGV